MATTTSKPEMPGSSVHAGASAPQGGVPEAAVPAWPREQGVAPTPSPGQSVAGSDHPSPQPSQRDALQALLAFSALHQQVRHRKALAAKHQGFDAAPRAEFPAEFEDQEQFILDEVLQLVAERAVAITGADGLAIALAENEEIVLRAAAGTVRPDIGARIDRDSAFSGACFRTAQIINCDDTEVDPRVNLQACRKLGARSMVAVPLCGRRRVIGLLEAFSSWPFAFNDSDVRNLSLLAELVLGALKPEDEDRFAQSAQVAATKLEAVALEAASKPAVAPTVPPAPVVPASKVEAPKAATLPTKPLAPPIPQIAKAEPPQPPIAAAPIVDVPKPTEKVAASEAALAAAAPAPPELSFTQPEPESRRPVVLVLLVCIVVAAAFAGGVWWKVRTAQLAHVALLSDRVAKPAARAPSQNATAATAGNSAASANISTDVTANETELYSPATPQELSKFPRISGVRHWSSVDSTTVVLDLEDQVQYEAHRLAGPDRIYFDLHDTQLAPDLAGKTIDVGDTLLNRVRVAQPVAGMTRIVLETKADSNFSVSLEPNPYRLVVEVSKVGVTPKTTVNLFPNATENKLAIVVPPPTKEDMQLRARVPKMRVVVDAGHGGWDLGTVGRRGLLEKDLVLEIAQRLDKLLESRLGWDVILTRDDDNYIPLDQRADIANQAQADLFVSVHANYSDLPSARGVETYYTNSFSAPGSKEAGPKEPGGKNAAGALTGVGTKNSIMPALSPADLHERIEQSRRLAASVQRSLYGTLSTQNPGLRDRGIKEAGFVVLTESAMPGILAEVSFVSSPTDEQKLRSDGYREEIAEALYKGIARYAASSKGVKLAAKQLPVASNQ